MTSQYQMQTMIPRPIVSTPQGFKKTMQMTYATVSQKVLFCEDQSIIIETFVIIFSSFHQSLPLGVPAFRPIPQETIQVKDNVLKMQTVSPSKYHGPSYRRVKVHSITLHWHSHQNSLQINCSIVRTFDLIIFHSHKSIKLISIFFDLIGQRVFDSINANLGRKPSTSADKLRNKFRSSAAFLCNADSGFENFFRTSLSNWQRCVVKGEWK